MMKLRYLYSIMCIFSLLALPGCREEEAVQTSEGTRTVTVNLGIAMSRVTEGSSVGDGSTPKDMKVWIFNQDDTKLIDYYEVQSPQFLGSDILGELVNTDEHVFELDNSITDLHFYAVLNSESGTGLDLSKASTPTQIESATFTALNNVAGDNQVPVYGKATLDVSDHKNSYPVTIETKRAVSKLELFFTKESENSELKITNIKLEHVPTFSYLDEGHELTGIKYDQSRDNILAESETGEIKTSLPATMPIGNFSEYETNFTKLTLTSAYWLENTNGGTWAGTTEDSNKDYTYTNPYDIEKQTDDEVDDGTVRYKMTISYELSGNDKTQVVYLPAMKRNEWNKIYARVKEDNFVIALNVLPWEDVENSQIGWDPNSYFEYGSKAPMVAWRMLKVNDDDNSPMKIDPDHKNATNGDEEATCCYVLYPRYGRSNGQSDHGTLVARTSYAAFYFCMQKPEGAVWEAYLSNPNDFELSTGGDYDSDQDGINDKCCVMTGIAREEPYQIQVGAKHAWTKASREMGESFEGADYGWDDLTDEWGKIIESNGQQYNIYTDLKIRVSLDNGVTWNDLKINPIDDYVEATYWNTNRRFAGDDHSIRIWQLKAEKDEDSFVELVNHLKNDTEGDWAILDYWKGAE
ncbi:MAG: hypothetical protein H9802_01965 [Candidatus Phocaeicola faecipullorum]|nr:hypothetical protein [Candidatus Phocaeicola faecipullorum]